MQKKKKGQPGQPRPDKLRVVLEEPEYRLVDDTFGYVSLFPLMMRLVEPASDQLGHILRDLRNPTLLWTDYGLRSLAKSSPLYDKRYTYLFSHFCRVIIFLFH